MRNALRTALCACALAVAAPAHALDKIAVLELQNNAELTDQENRFLTDVLRGAALSLPPSHYLVMTRESVLDFLPPGADLGKICSEANCEVALGRKLGADYVVSGELLRFGGRLKASVKLHDTQSGALMGRHSAEATSVAEMEGALASAGIRLFSALATGRSLAAGAGQGRGGAVVRRPTAAEAAAEVPWQPESAVPVTIESVPSGAALRINGGDAVQTPWTELVSPGPARLELVLPHYKTARREVQFTPQSSGDTQHLRVQLEPNHGTLRVLSEPAGASIEIDGRSVGRSPWESGPLTLGEHRVTAQLRHHHRAEVTLTVAVGRRRELLLRPTPRQGGLQVLTRGTDGRSVSTEVYLDGRLVGDTPFTGAAIEGEHRLELRDPEERLATHIEEVTVEYRQTLRRSLTLRPRPPHAPEPSIERVLTPEPPSVPLKWALLPSVHFIFGGGEAANLPSVSIGGGFELGVRLGDSFYLAPGVAFVSHIVELPKRWREDQSPGYQYLAGDSVENTDTSLPTVEWTFRAGWLLSPRGRVPILITGFVGTASGDAVEATEEGSGPYARYETDGADPSTRFAGLELRVLFAARTSKPLERGWWGFGGRWVRLFAHDTSLYLLTGEWGF